MKFLTEFLFRGAIALLAVAVLLSAWLWYQAS